MHMTVRLAAFAGTLFLASCGGSGDADADGDGAVSGDEMTQAMERVTPLQPGQYKMAMELVELEDPTVKAEDIAQAKQMFAQMGNMAPPRCLTEEDANRGLVGIAEGMQQGNCTTKSLTTDANGMKAEMVCRADGSTEAQLTLDAQASETSSQMTMTVVEPVAGQGGSKRVVMKVGMTRVGDCPA